MKRKTSKPVGSTLFTETLLKARVTSARDQSTSYVEKDMTMTFVPLTRISRHFAQEQRFIGEVSTLLLSDGVGRQKGGTLRPSTESMAA